MIFEKLYSKLYKIMEKWWLWRDFLERSAHRNTFAATTPSPAVAPSSAGSPRWWAGGRAVANGRRGSWRGVSPRGYRVSIPALARTGRHGRDKGVPAGNRPCIAGIPCGERQAHALPCKLSASGWGCAYWFPMNSPYSPFTPSSKHRDLPVAWNRGTVRLGRRLWYNSHWHRCHKAGQYIIEKRQIRICALFDGFYGCLVNLCRAGSNPAPF